MAYHNMNFSVRRLTFLVKRLPATQTMPRRPLSQTVFL